MFQRIRRAVTSLACWHTDADECRCKCHFQKGNNALHGVLSSVPCLRQENSGFKSLDVNGLLDFRQA